ncbi:UbiA family prenyltransferase [Falsiroseomonas sp.]|uniref:UbiA family prenyltransferase n=1 Tax=Falsiroseomonas sp. TaxID=2870721 RepID=UPI00273374EF|nr:UbiA family prenyltransferase [Falsiroseomonas sp.]MDP3418329.1 UbiA family prenyltransferase [Falsiroseomonas sp.]
MHQQGTTMKPSDRDNAGRSAASTKGTTMPRLAEDAVLARGGLAYRLPARMTRPEALAQLRALLESARPHQWAKNLLVFVPAVLSGTIADPDRMLSVGLAFVALCLIASGTYLLNDIRDLEDDRRHWSKCKRPLPSGRLSVGMAMVAAPVAIVLGLLLSAAVGPMTALAAACYLGLTLAYSLVIKRIPILDVSVLAGLFTLRLVLGIASAQVYASPWLLVFSMFLFSSLCLAKRYVELVRAGQRGTSALSHRGYQAADGPLLLVLGPSAGMGAVVTLILYVMFDAFRQTFYGNTAWLWAFPLILFLWVSRIWLKAARGELDDDPVAFAVRDVPSILLGAVMLSAFVFAWSGLFG